MNNLMRLNIEIQRNVEREARALYVYQKLMTAANDAPLQDTKLTDEQRTKVEQVRKHGVDASKEELKHQVWMFDGILLRSIK